MRTWGRLAPLAVAFGLSLTFCAELAGQQNSIENQLNRVDWQPTWEIPGARYAGTKVCARCHPTEAAAHQASAMAHALTPAVGSLVLQSHPRLTFSDGPYHYTIERKGAAISYAVTDGKNTVSVPVLWAFGYGRGEVGQTYLLSYQAAYYESRVTFYSGVAGLDITLGHPVAVPASLEAALGRVVKPEELRACFGCHSTRAVSEGRLRLDKLIPGITCEGCHGPGAEHVASMRAGRSQKAYIFNPASLTAGDLVKFCGACHRARAQVRALGLRGIAAVRFQPYRLSESACFNPRDRRISCLACHDPHRNPEHDPAFYDPKCLACHGGGNGQGASGTHQRARRLARLQAPRAGTTQRKVPGCTVANSRCVTCHMPKYELRGSHFKFADHKIRVVRLGDTFD